ncbi:neutral zinc metallopeptidase, partial [Tessaracoccus sp. SD287]|uniref:neutral zinc metallopeptidase n=1 Tax=Tessaracoccus sp. SD287 TaxID=2782008 RepID=UPI001A97CA9B
QPPPTSWAARPAPRPPRRTGRIAAVLTLFLVVGVVAGVALSGYFDRGSTAAPVKLPTTTSTTATTATATGSPTATASASSTPTPTSTFTPFRVPKTKWKALPVPSPSTRAQRTVQANPLYDIAMPVATTCPAIPDDIGLNAAFRTISQELLDCQFVAWQPIFEDLGWPLDKPQLVTFRDSVSTACGTVSDEQSFYCPASAEIYLSEQRFESSQDWWRLHFVNTIVHEFLHHVQSSAGILEAAYLLDLREDERTRRVELQAYCMTSRIMVITPAFEFGAEDYRILKQWTTEGGSDTHGSVSSRKHWWLRGFDQSTPAGCNTWVVDADQVT